MLSIYGMKNFARIVFITLISILFFSCVSAPAQNTTGDNLENNGITAQGTFGGQESDPDEPMFMGDGGSNVRLAILAPEISGDIPAYLPVHVQGLLNNIFNRYSAINIIDRQNLDRIIYEQDLAAGGRFSDRDFVTIGNLANTQYFLFGNIQRLSSGRYSLQLSITEAGTGIRRATFMMEASLEQFEGRAVLINQAALDLLTQMGIILTETGRRTLLQGNTSVVMSEGQMARGITALMEGDELGAFFSITQAMTFDPSNLEAFSRLSVISSNIIDGTISERIVNDILARDRWVEVFKETASFFNDHPPFEIIFDPKLIQIGETDFARRTANIGMRISLDPSQAGFGALNSLLEGLEQTNRREAWGFSGWPLMDLTPRERDTVVFNGRRNFSFRVDVQLINDYGIILGNSSISLNTEQIRFSPGDKIIVPPQSIDSIVVFSNIRAEDLTPRLTISILGVNGISSRDIAASGFMRIDTGDLEAREQQRQEELLVSQAEEAIAAEARAAEAAARAAARRQEAVREGWDGSFFLPWEKDGRGFGLSTGFYWSPSPYTSVGFDLRWTRFRYNEPISVRLRRSGPERNINIHEEYIFGLSPLAGLVYPMVNNTQLFANVFLDLYFNFDYPRETVEGRSFTAPIGMLTDWATPGFELGLQFKKFNIKYRGTWFKEAYRHTVGIGWIFLRWR